MAQPGGSFVRDTFSVLLPGGKGHVAMLTAYFDASGIDPKDEHFILAGFVAPTASWVQFEQEWAGLLATPRYAKLLPVKNGKTYAHARKIAQWPAALREAFYGEANYLLRRIKAVGTAVTYKHADYDYAFEHFPHTVKDSRYGLGFRLAMSYCCKLIVTTVPDSPVADSPIAFVVEHGDPNQGGAQAIFHKTKGSQKLLIDGRRAFNLSTFAIQFKEDWGALQAADLHAYTLLKHLQSPLGSGTGKSDKYFGDINLLLQELLMSHFAPGRAEIHRLKEAMVWAGIKPKVFGEAKYGTSAKRPSAPAKARAKK
jgi:hypothetical protein